MNAIADGTYRLGKDQKPDGPMAAAFKNNMERHVAIAVILGMYSPMFLSFAILTQP